MFTVVVIVVVAVSLPVGLTFRKRSRGFLEALFRGSSHKGLTHSGSLETPGAPYDGKNERREPRAFEWLPRASIKFASRSPDGTRFSGLSRCELGSQPIERITIEMFASYCYWDWDCHWARLFCCCATSGRAGGRPSRDWPAIVLGARPVAPIGAREPAYRLQPFGGRLAGHCKAGPVMNYSFGQRGLRASCWSRADQQEAS